MSDYSSMAQPQSQQNQSLAFAAALQRAKQVCGVFSFFLLIL